MQNNPNEAKHGEKARDKNRPETEDGSGGLQIQLPSERGREWKVREAVSGIRSQGPHGLHQEVALSGQLKVIKVDKVSMDYYIRLGEFHRQFQAVGNNYNQVVRAVQKNFGEQRARSLLYRLEKATLELILLSKQIMSLTREYEEKWLPR